MALYCTSFAKPCNFVCVSRKRGGREREKKHKSFSESWPLTRRDRNNPRFRSHTISHTHLFRCHTRSVLRCKGQWVEEAVNITHQNTIDTEFYRGSGTHLTVKFPPEADGKQCGECHKNRQKFATSRCRSLTPTAPSVIAICFMLHLSDSNFITHDGGEATRLETYDTLVSLKRCSTIAPRPLVFLVNVFIHNSFPTLVTL